MVESSDFDMTVCSPADREWSEQFRFDLYLRNNEVKEVYDLLSGIRIKDSVAKQQFIEENGEVLDSLALELWEKSQTALTEVCLDKESLQLLTEYTGRVRDTFSLLHELKSAPLANKT